ncbi:MAG TPA: 7-carboxy-7-deazaguanine synthase QueE [Polyangiaceae bacterium LLY-WYZ-15_(1-7)]|nr:hypothetical protein [Myxococcales bacterium]MAT27666.1 hypothetical protein [Sandaracinus sp.]HJL05673.1 7-carboxy-7-deazaguanine synthase QueE [Polyangiaceae bacterium LLY-WYZ-15_(1-7)]MBJ70006.1 hypothetical protein [Sandaracinus sp.]HJL08061.1 7-carboxy-7-deazaguanine synthase QueE [Polyangiaceae bacterium LLY-WYZ-15_(1-7)]
MKLRIAKDRLLVSEIFDSVQGEGPSAGTPSTFLRLGHCNLRCAWCDTPYTWDWERHRLEDELRAWDLDALAADLVARAPQNLVVTGGEPLLQRDALAALLPRLGKRVEVETAGTLPPELEGVAQWNVSPKLASSGNPLDKRWRPDVLRAFARREDAVFKFVIASEADLEELRARVSELALPPERVWLMPEGTDAATLAERGRALSEVCVQEGWRLGWRLHVSLWGDRRGV